MGVKNEQGVAEAALACVQGAGVFSRLAPGSGS